MTTQYKINDRVRVIGIGNGEISKIRFDDRDNPIYTVHMYDGTDFYARDVELYLESKEPATVRPLSAIAAEIKQNWPKMYFGAVPYVDAMSQLNAVTDTYICDSAKSIVLYFIANAGTWRGDVARRIKAELKGMVKQ